VLRREGAWHVDEVACIGLAGGRKRTVASQPGTRLRLKAICLLVFDDI
jgi:hypothetical protein